MIFAEEPTNWKDLENRVAYILKGVGFSVKTEHNIETARGSVNIDVYAVKNKPSPPIHCLCECKYWNKNIPQSVIHSFRSVVSDSGANVGYIISKNGFQKGALETAENTNIIMFTWDQFLNNYKEEWHRSKIKAMFALSVEFLKVSVFSIGYQYSKILLKVIHINCSKPHLTRT